MGRRVRQHVNPLALKYAEPRAKPVPRPSHLGPEAPIDVELGCADADFSFALARNNPSRFVVALDIRERQLEKNRLKAEAAILENLRFGYVNLNVDLDRVFEPASVDRFHLLFPDPWFKVRHKKRRVISEPLIEALATRLKPGGELHFASDVYEVALEALAELESDEAVALGFSNLRGPWSFWRGNPFGAQSRREVTTLRRGQRVWRMRYQLGVGESASTEGSSSASSSDSQRS